VSDNVVENDYDYVARMLVRPKRTNICGLISGNLKRHLAARHEYGEWFISTLFGNHLLEMIDHDCTICANHTESLIAEMSKAR
jgi:hypothetical protein